MGGEQALVSIMTFKHQFHVQIFADFVLKSPLNCSYYLIMDKERLKIFPELGNLSSFFWSKYL